MIDYINKIDRKKNIGIEVKEKISSYIKLKDIYLNLSYYFEKINDYKQALSYYKKYHRVEMNLEQNRIKEKINKLRENQSLSEYISTHDFLTGLYNRTYFEIEKNIINKSKFKNLGIVFCDIDCLKIINDTFGHLEGDKLIMCISNILKKCTIKGEKLLRFGGDEFLIIVKNTTKYKLNKLIKKIIKLLNSNFIGEKKLPVSMSLGYAIGNSNEMSLEDIIKKADENMYNNKISRREEVKNNLMDKIQRS